MKEKCYDLIRSVGILLIIIWHFNTVCCENGFKLPFLLLWNKSGTIQAGGVGVVLFFCLSGALLIKKYKENFNTLQFIKKRLLRIYIPHWISYVIAFIVSYSVYANTYTFKSIMGILFSFLGMDYFGESLYAIYNIPTYWLVGEWFTAVIVILYCIFPVLRFLYIKREKTTTIIIMLIFILNLKLQILSYGSGWFSITNGLFAFWLGMLFEKYKNNINKYTLIGSTLIFIGLLIFNPKQIIGFIYLPTFVTGIMLFIMLLHVNYSCNMIEYLCKYNFEIYLVHHRIFIYLIPLFLKIATANAQICLVFIGLIILTFMIAEKIQLISNKIINACK